MKLSHIGHWYVLLLSLCLFTGCWAFEAPPEETTETKINEVEPEKPEGDTSVSSEDGGPGFKGEGWTTAEPRALGSEEAVKGGTILTDISDWPNNLRVYGEKSNVYTNHYIGELIYETLCRRDPHTLEWVPRLASHWKISEDQLTFQFRINPKAHWNDGKPVTSEDVIATYDLLMDQSLLEPSYREICTHFNRPEAISKYIVQFKAKEKSWRNFIDLNLLYILPAHELDGIDGKEFLNRFNFKYTASSGPYVVAESDIKRDESLVMTRRENYWGKDDPFNQGLYNFDKIIFRVIRDRRIGFDTALSGELDFKVIYTAKWWVEDVDDLPATKMGQLIRQQVYTKVPQGIQGWAFNMRNPPLDDVRVRKALAHLFDRRTMVAKFAYNTYLPLSSYFTGGGTQNKSNEIVEYDPQEAVKLLAAAGWKDRGQDGILVKDNKRLSLHVKYSSAGFEKYLTTYQSDCAKAGVELKLDLVIPTTLMNNLATRDFDMANSARTGSFDPDPRIVWHSRTAVDENGEMVKNTPNATGFQSKKADDIIEKYDREFDSKKRQELLRQLDAVIYEQHPYALQWYLPCERLLYWNKFGMPKTVLAKYTDWTWVFSSWWVDPEKEAKLKEARGKAVKLVSPPPLEVHPWDDKS